ncbi:MAG: class I SAM-dependent methyltransferase [Verrucomicrobiales bacterium]
MITKDDPALAALMLALERRGVGDGEQIAFLRARPHEALHPLRHRLVCEQSWKPSADELAKRGFPSQSELLERWGEFDLVLLLPERQREQTLFDLARGISLLKPQGRLLAAMPNDWGAARYEKHLAALAPGIETLSKFHCRAFSARRTERIDAAKVDQWRRLGEMRPMVHGERFMTCPGLFSWDKIDRGSELLIGHLPTEITGRVADLGAGWGFLAAFLLRERPQMRVLDLYEADARAIDAARHNLAFITTRTVVCFHWHDATQDLGKTYDFIVMNAPFHTGRAAEPSLGQRFISSAAGALRPGGQLWMVANQNLPYERTLATELGDPRLIIQVGGFKVLSATKSPRK